MTDDDQGYYERQDIRRDLDTLRREVWALKNDLGHECSEREELQRQVNRLREETHG